MRPGSPGHQGGGLRADGTPRQPPGYSCLELPLVVPCHRAHRPPPGTPAVPGSVSHGDPGQARGLLPPAQVAPLPPDSAPGRGCYVTPTLWVSVPRHREVTQPAQSGSYGPAWLAGGLLRTTGKTLFHLGSVASGLGLVSPTAP